MLSFRDSYTIVPPEACVVTTIWLSVLNADSLLLAGIINAVNTPAGLLCRVHGGIGHFA